MTLSHQAEFFETRINSSSKFAPHQRDTIFSKVLLGFQLPAGKMTNITVHDRAMRMASLIMVGAQFEQSHEIEVATLDETATSR